MKHASLLTISCLGMLLMTVNTDARNIYKWTDEEGNVHYGERPPATGATEVRIRDRGGIENVDTPSTAAKPSTQVDPKVQRDKMIKAMEGDRLARQEKKQKKAEQQKKHKMQCAQAKDTLRRYKSAGSLYNLDANGNRITLPQSVKQQETKRLQAEIKKWCK